MSGYIGATGYSENQEQFDILKDEIDANASYINNLVGIPDPLHLSLFGINPLNPGLFGLVERAEVKIKLLETGEETLGTDITGLTTQVEGIQSEILGIQGEITGIDSSISSIQFVQLPALSTSLAILIGATDVIAVDARNKANRSLDIWDYSGDNVYHKKSGNVGIGTTFGSVLTNKLEVQGNINIPTGSTFRIGDEPFNYSHLAGEQPVSSKWTNATDVATNIYYNTGNVGIGVTTAINNKLEVAGNINIPTGSKYKINNVDLAFSDLGTLSYNSLSDKPTLFDGNYNSLTNKLTGGTNIQILNGAINNLYSYTLPTAGVGSGGNLGGVRVDNSTIFINNGVISSAGTSYTLPVATTDILGGVKLDGTSIVDVNGKITAVQVQADWNVTNTLSRAYILNKPIIPNNSQWTYSGTQIYYNGGNVGIGTSSTNALLHLHKTGLVQDVRIQLTDGTTTGGANRGLHLIKSGNTGHLFNYEDAPLLLGTNGTSRIAIDNVGNVGIGINTPIGRLHLHRENATTSQDVNLHFTDTLTGSTASDGFVIGKGSDNIAYLYNNENTAMVFGVNGGERMRITANRGVGIQNNGYCIANNQMSAGSLAIGNINANYGGGTGDNNNIAGLMLECLDNTEIAVHDYGQAFHSFMRYTTNGNFRIGRNMGWGVANVNMSGALGVDNYISAGSYIISSGRVYSRNGFDTWIYSDGGSMSINFGNINTETAPTYLKIGAYGGHTFIESNQSRIIHFKIYTGTFSGTAPTWRFEPSFNCFNANNSTNWNQVSDQRIKENIIKADLKTCFDNVKNINLYRYNYIDAFDNEYRDKNKLGYIAQEVKRHFPKATIRSKTRLNDKREIPDLLTIDVEQINLTLYGAVKQLIKIVEKQNKRIKTLETLLNIDDNDDVENDAGEAYERIYDEEEVDIDTIEPTEPEQDKAPEPTATSVNTEPSTEEDIEEINVD